MISFLEKAIDVKTFYSSFTQPWLHESMVLMVKAGSHAYGTNTPESDLDYRGICVPPREYFLGFQHRFEQAETMTPYDIAIHDIRKFFRLAADGNVQFMEMLFSPEECVVVDSVQGRMLRMQRQLFISKNMHRAISGFAYSQWCRLSKQEAETGQLNGKMLMHCIRLLRMGIELFSQTERPYQLNVRRPDAEELLDIRLGGDPPDIKAMLRELDARAEASAIPNQPDRGKLDELCQHIVGVRMR